MELKEFDKMAEFEETYWWWVGKRNIIKSILNRLNLDHANILDGGCGTGFNLKYLKDYGNITGLDISREALDFCKKRENKKLVQADAENLPFKDGVFDVLTSLDCLEHLDDDRCIKEYFRVLKPEGHLIVTVPAFMFLWSKHDEALHHKRRYNKDQLKNLLESNGFKVIKLSYWNFFLLFPIVAIRLVKKWVANGEDEVETDIKELPNIINSFLISVLKFESSIISLTNLPIGVGLICVGKLDK